MGRKVAVFAATVSRISNRLYGENIVDMAAMARVAFLLLLLGMLPACVNADDAVAVKARRLYDEGSAALKRSDYNIALSKFLEYINIEEQAEKKDTACLLYAYYNVGGVYSVYSDFAQAFEIYRRGYAVSVEAGDAEMQFKLLNNMIGSSCNLKETGRAESLNERVRALKGIDRGLQAYYYFFNKGFIAGSRADNAAKAQYMKTAISMVDKYRLPGEMKIYAYSELYLSYENMGQLDMALSSLIMYDSLAHVMNQAYLYVDCYKGMMRIYTKMGDKEKALFYQNQYFKYTDSLLNINEFSKIKTGFQVDEKQRKDATISNLRKTNTLQSLILVMLVLLVTLAVVAVVVFYRQRQKLHYANLALFRRNGELLEIERKYRMSIELSDDTVSAGRHTDTGDHTVGASGHDSLVKKIMAVMEDETVFCNPDFSLTMLAHLTESNTNYVSQAINTTFGKNFRSFVNEYRIKLAMKRMMDTGRYGNYSIQGISESVGYKSASNFISSFRKVTGMTPSLYQKLSNKGEPFDGQ